VIIILYTLFPVAMLPAVIGTTVAAACAGLLWLEEMRAR